MNVAAARSVRGAVRTPDQTKAGDNHERVEDE
jgi:hypothetical protein